MISVFPNIVDINFDYWMETLPAKFLQCKVATFPFVSILWGEFFKTVDILFLVYFLPTNFNIR